MPIALFVVIGLFLGSIANAGDTWVPPDRPAPSMEEAEALIDELLARIRTDDLEPEWLATVFRPRHLPAGPDDSQLERLHGALTAGALGRSLLRSPANYLTVRGPDYVRVVLGSTHADPIRPSAVIRTGELSAVIDELGYTTCTLCSEPARFVRDLLHDVQRQGDKSYRLLPGVELYLANDLAENRHHDSSLWVGALEDRLAQGGPVRALLEVAHVAGAEDDQVEVIYADGRREPWTVVWIDGMWRVDYHALPENSPLRLDSRALRDWRSAQVIHQNAVDRWTPRFIPIDNGSGLELGDRAIGAAFDPLDGSVIVAVLDINRVLAGVFRVDTETQEVTQRWHLSPPRTQTSMQEWFDRWEFALSLDGGTVAMSVPDRVWQIDLESGRLTTADRVRDVTSLVFSAETILHAARANGEVRSYGGANERRRGAEDPLLVTPTGDGLATVSVNGLVTVWTANKEHAPATTDRTTATVCCGQVADAAGDPRTGGAIVACGNPCSIAAVTVTAQGQVTELARGAGSVHAGVSMSPTGQYFTTGAQGDAPGLFLWTTEPANPVARLANEPLRSVSWSPNGTEMVGVTTGGRVLWWNIALVRRRVGL